MDEEYNAEIEEAVEKATLELLPSKSREQYNIAYNRFIEWCKSKNVEGKLSEKVLLAYFEEKSHIWKSSTLCSNYSMIKLCANVNGTGDLSKFYKLTAFLKRKSENYKPKKSKILTRENIDTFLTDAPNEKYLMMKVAAIFGIFRACRRKKLFLLTVDQIEDLGTSLLIHIPTTKTKVRRNFCIVGDLHIGIYTSYSGLRSKSVTNRRFFLKYANSKCTSQPVGINTFGKMPYEIATLLKLPERQLYTGHCFRRSSATLLADTGADLVTIKRHGGWNASAHRGYSNLDANLQGINNNCSNCTITVNICDKP